MLTRLSAHQLTVQLPKQALDFATTNALTPTDSEWTGQAEAEKAARFGLGLYKPGFNIMVVGLHGSGRTSLMMQLMQEYAAKRAPSPDMVLLHQFETPEKPLLVVCQAATGHLLCKALDHALRQLGKAVPQLVSQLQPNESDGDKKSEHQADAPVVIDATQIATLKQDVTAALHSILHPVRELVNAHVLDQASLEAYFEAYTKDILDNLELFVPNSDNETLLDGYLSRFRANLLVDNRGQTAAPVIYDDDPSYQSLFGGYEASGEHNSHTADFLRIRSGNLLRANGGTLMLHMRDIMADQQTGMAIVEKLHRVLRNHRLLIEESSAGASAGSASHFKPEAIPLEVKLVMVCTHEEFHELQEEFADFMQYFPVKVEFTDRLPAKAEHYQSITALVARACQRHQLLPFEQQAVARLMVLMQRRIDDQQRISSDFAHLITVMIECDAIARSRQADVVTDGDVKSAIALRLARHHSTEQQLREAILDDEVMISTKAQTIGQINALTHIDVGDHSFGSPVRITARCFAGREGVMNIDREVQMTGPNHDKGLLILRNWLSANFADLTPLSLSASLVFEQEYMGVEGDSASCAELFALLSALSGVGLKQGIAVTGALNQHGEVMPIGGVNEKIEGYFRLCQAIGLDGTQGVLIPRRNQTHLILDDDVIAAVEANQFHIYAIDHVAEGMALLTGTEVSGQDEQGQFLPDSLMGKVREKLILFKTMYERNRQTVIQNSHE